jgi:hypothetical protein
LFCVFGVQMSATLDSAALAQKSVKFRRRLGVIFVTNNTPTGLHILKAYQEIAP